MINFTYMKEVKSDFIMVRATLKYKTEKKKQAKKKGYTLSEYIRLLLDNDKTS